MLSLSVRIVGVFGFLPSVFRRVCVCGSVPWPAHSGSGAVAAPKGLGSCLLVTSVSVVAPKTYSAKSISVPTSFLSNSFSPSPPAKVFMIPGPGNPRGCKPSGESQTAWWSGSALCKPEPLMDSSP